MRAISPLRSDPCFARLFAHVHALCGPILVWQINRFFSCLEGEGISDLPARETFMAVAILPGGWRCHRARRNDAKGALPSPPNTSWLIPLIPAKVRRDPDLPCEVWFPACAGMNG
jgi:hypothetical protein